MSLKKRHLSYLFTIALLFALGGTGDLLSENIFLKDGRIINGSITGDAAKSITVRKADGKSEVISRDNILRILYTELAMGKIHVQMRDGSNFEAFIVDEDQKSFTFRKVLLSPDELKVDRSDILFISERNPSGLKGTPDTGSIELSWFPPYNPVKHYLVYHQGKKRGRFPPGAQEPGEEPHSGKPEEQHRLCNQGDGGGQFERGVVAVECADCEYEEYTAREAAYTLCD